MSRLTRISTLLVLLFTATQATVFVPSTAEHFPSYPDQLVGLRFMEGVSYGSRLQHIPDHLNLCLDQRTSAEYNIVQPRDHSKVALLVRGGGCSDVEKARIAAYNTYPSNVVKYLIIYGDDETEGNFESHEAAEREKLNREPIYYDDIPLGVVHVSMNSGHALLRLLLDQENKLEGGLPVLIDGQNASRSKVLRTVLFWFGVSLMICGCCCSFLLSMQIQEMLGIAPEQPANPRPERRRLTPEQVEEFAPLSYYNGHAESEEGITDLHECIICLDEFQMGDKIRTLPCGHIFHDECIARWLIARHSTCPLCKLDLYVDEEEEEEEPEEDVEQMNDEETGYVAMDDEEANRASIFELLTGTLRRFRRRGERLFESEGNGTQALPLEGEISMTEPLLTQSSFDPEDARQMVETSPEPSDVNGSIPHAAQNEETVQLVTEGETSSAEVSS